MIWKKQPNILRFIQTMFKCDWYDKWKKYHLFIAWTVLSKGFGEKTTIDEKELNNLLKKSNYI